MRKSSFSAGSDAVRPTAAGHKSAGKRGASDQHSSTSASVNCPWPPLLIVTSSFGTPAAGAFLTAARALLTARSRLDTCNGNADKFRTIVIRVD
jgi:hypothetical protein